MDSWDRARLVGMRAKARLDAILADPEESKRVQEAVINGNALLSLMSKRKTIPEYAENHGSTSGHVE